MEDQFQKRALFFVNSFTGGGAEKVCLNLADELYRMNIESDFILIYNNAPDYDIPKHIHIFSLGIEDKPLACFRMLSRIPEVDAFISDKRYVLITAHLQPSYLLASLTKVGKKTLYVMHVTQHLWDKNYSVFYRMKLRMFLRGKKIVTVSKGLQEELEHEYGIASENITTIYNPCVVTLSEEKPPHERPYILVMGRLEEQKNPLLALELYYKGGFYDRYDLVYLGKGSLMDELEKRIAAYHLQDHVLLAGFQKNPGQWLVNAKLLLSCSKQEGFAMNLAEALICKTPVVSFDCPHGPREILTKELSKYLIEPEMTLDESIKVISLALKSYPAISEKYYRKFESGIILQTYMETWGKYFQSKKNLEIKKDLERRDSGS